MEVDVQWNKKLTQCIIMMHNECIFHTPVEIMVLWVMCTFMRIADLGVFSLYNEFLQEKQPSLHSGTTPATLGDK